MDCTFELNDQDMSELKWGVRRYKAFSGYNGYKNQRLQVCVRDFGPIPAGRYYIVDRPTGGLLGPIRDWVTGKDEWFALFKDDSSIDDEMLCDELKRGNFRLHPKGPAGISRGCITFEHAQEFDSFRETVLNQEKFAIPNSSFQAYGTVTVK